MKLKKKEKKEGRLLSFTVMCQDAWMPSLIPTKWRLNKRIQVYGRLIFKHERWPNCIITLNVFQVIIHTLWAEDWKQ